jgi:ferredoxin
MKTATAGGWDTCALCPRLCRPSCPVASGSTREASVPAVIAARLLDWQRDRLDPATAAEAATLCTDCGACQSHCHLDRPLPGLLRQARAELLPAAPFEPLRPIEGEGRIVAVEADERPFASALSRRLGEPVRRWPTADRLGVEAVEHREWERHGEAIRAALGGAEAVVCDGGVARALEAAGARFRWLHDVVPGLPTGTSSCKSSGGPRPAACCGAGGPLRRHHPEDARRVGELWLRRGEPAPLNDARCRSHLRDCGGDVRDLLDALLETT